MKHVVYLDNEDLARLKHGESVTIQGVEVRLALSEYKMKQLDETAQEPKKTRVGSKTRAVLNLISSGNGKKFSGAEISKHVKTEITYVRDILRRLSAKHLIVAHQLGADPRGGMQYSANGAAK